MTILIICVYALNRNNRAKLYLASTFHTSGLELLIPKLKPDIYIYIYLTNTPKRNHIYKLRFHMLKEHPNINILTC